MQVRVSTADVLPLRHSKVHNFMITVISGTDRMGSRTLQVARHYFGLLNDLKEDAQLFNLEDWKPIGRTSYLEEKEQHLLIPSQKFVFVMPEYNGSFPGILKLLLDQTDIRKCWWHKKALLVGVADGRGGNLRGIEHMTNILHYLKMNVFYNKLPLSRINEELDVDGRFVKDVTLKSIEEQLGAFVKY